MSYAKYKSVSCSLLCERPKGVIWRIWDFTVFVFVFGLARGGRGGRGGTGGGAGLARVRGLGGPGLNGTQILGLGVPLAQGGGPVGVRAGFWMGGGLAAEAAVLGCGDGGRCFPTPGEGGREREPCLWEGNTSKSEREREVRRFVQDCNRLLLASYTKQSAASTGWIVRRIV